MEVLGGIPRNTNALSLSINKQEGGRSHAFGGNSPRISRAADEVASASFFLCLLLANFCIM